MQHQRSQHAATLSRADLHEHSDDLATSHTNDHLLMIPTGDRKKKEVFMWPSVDHEPHSKQEELVTYGDDPNLQCTSDTNQKKH